MAIICGAWRKSPAVQHLRCRKHAKAGRRRCWVHDRKGRPKGVVTVLGPAHAALRKRQALYKALGLKWPHGTPMEPRRARNIAREAKKLVRETQQKMRAALPALVDAASDNRDLAELTPPEALARVAFKGLQRLDEILSIKIPYNDKLELREMVKVYRMVGDMAVAANRMFGQMGENSARIKRDQALAALIDEIRIEKSKA